jgi:two-component SAPR family response regulator
VLKSPQKESVFFKLGQVITVMLRAKKITVYDSTTEDCGIAADTLRDLFSRTGIKVVVKEFTEYEKFAYDFRDNHYDLAFVWITSVLDLEAARAVRQLDAKCPLFLISRDKDFSLEGYRFGALDFIIKPVTVERLRESISRTPLYPMAVNKNE